MGKFFKDHLLGMTIFAILTSIAASLIYDGLKSPPQGDGPGHPSGPTGAAPLRTKTDREAISELKWKLQDAFTTLYSTGDGEPLVGLCVTKHNQSTPAMQQIFDKIREWRQGQTNIPPISAVFTRWAIQSIEGDNASLDVEWVLRPAAAGSSDLARNRAKINLAKIEGEWLLTNGGQLY